MLQRTEVPEENLFRDKGGQKLMIFLIIWNNIKRLVNVYNLGGRKEN